MGIKTKALIVTYIFGTLCLLFAFYVYIVYRTVTIPIVFYSERLGVLELLLRFKLPNVPEWFVYSLPDGLWMLSYELLLGAFWKFNVRSRAYWAFSICLPIGAVAYELMQRYSVTGGTFDVVDIVFYMLALFVSCLYCYIINTYCYYEKI